MATSRAKSSDPVASVGCTNIGGSPYAARFFGGREGFVRWWSVKVQPVGAERVVVDGKHLDEGESRLAG